MTFFQKRLCLAVLSLYLFWLFSLKCERKKISLYLAILRKFLAYRIVDIKLELWDIQSELEEISQHWIQFKLWDRKLELPYDPCDLVDSYWNDWISHMKFSRVTVNVTTTLHKGLRTTKNHLNQSKFKCVFADHWVHCMCIVLLVPCRSDMGYWSCCTVWPEYCLQTPKEPEPAGWQPERARWPEHLLISPDGWTLSAREKEKIQYIMSSLRETLSFYMKDVVWHKMT